MSWTSEPTPARGGLGGSNLGVVLATSLVVSVGAPLLGYRLLEHLIIDAGPTGIDIRNAFFLTAALVGVGSAAPVFAAFATRLPFAGVGVALVSSVLLLGYDLVRGRDFFGIGDQVLWSVLLGSLCLLGADLVVWARRGLPLGIVPALAGGLAVAALAVVVQLASYRAHGAPLTLLLDNWRLAVQLLVDLPVLLLAGAALGWWLNRLLSPVSAPAAAG